MGKDHIYNIIARPNDLEETLRHTKVITQRTKCKKNEWYGLKSHATTISKMSISVCLFNVSFQSNIRIFDDIYLKCFFIYHHTDYYHEL